MILYTGREQFKLTYSPITDAETLYFADICHW